jgi:hypothetical protein
MQKLRYRGIVVRAGFDTSGRDGQYAAVIDGRGPRVSLPTDFDLWSRTISNSLAEVSSAVSLDPFKLPPEHLFPPMTLEFTQQLIHTQIFYHLPSTFCFRVNFNLGRDTRLPLGVLVGKVLAAYRHTLISFSPPPLGVVQSIPKETNSRPGGGPSSRMTEKMH